MKPVDSGDNEAADPLKEDEENKDEEKSKIAMPEFHSVALVMEVWCQLKPKKFMATALAAVVHTQTRKPEMLRVLSNQMRYHRYRYFYPLPCSLVDFLQLFPDPE